MNITEKIILAIVSMKKMQIHYIDKAVTKQYTVLPHLVGKNKTTENIVLSAYDVTENNEKKNSWKTFSLADIAQANIVDETFEHTQKGYNPNDSRMSSILANIPSVR